GGRSDALRIRLPIILPDQLGSRFAEEPFGLGVDVSESPVFVQRYEAVADTLQDVDDLFVGAPERLLAPPALGNVAADSRGSNHVSKRVANGRDCSGDFNQAAILAAAHRIIMNARFTSLDAIENDAGNFHRPLRNHEGKVAAYHFGRRVPEH